MVKLRLLPTPKLVKLLSLSDSCLILVIDANEMNFGGRNVRCVWANTLAPNSLPNFAEIEMQNQFHFLGAQFGKSSKTVRSSKLCSLGQIVLKPKSGFLKVLGQIHLTGVLVWVKCSGNGADASRCARAPSQRDAHPAGFHGAAGGFPRWRVHPLMRFRGWRATWPSCSYRNVFDRPLIRCGWTQVLPQINLRQNFQLVNYYFYFLPSARLRFFYWYIPTQHINNNACWMRACMHVNMLCMYACMHANKYACMHAYLFDYIAWLLARSNNRSLVHNFFIYC